MSKGGKEMLLPREKQILELLYTGHKEYTTSQIANLLQRSSRTIKADIKKIKDELTGTGCIIYTKTGKGLWLEYSNEGKVYLDNFLLKDENASSFLPETRKYYIALELLRSDKYISMESISEKLFVSKGTIMNDVNKLISFFENFDLKLDKSVKYGMILKGTEFKKRIAEAYVLRKIVVYQGNEILEKLQPFFYNVQLKTIGMIIQNAEEQFDLVISDHSYINCILQFAVMVEHLHQGKSCQGVNTIDKIDNLEWDITKYIVQGIQNYFQIHISSEDENYVYINVVGLKYQNKRIYQNRSLESIRQISPQTFDGIVEIMREVDAVYGEGLSEDEELMISIFIHLNALFARLMNSIYIENPLKKTIKSDLAYEYEIATYISQLLTREHYCLLKEDDICDLALYVGASLKRKKANSLQLYPTVVIVCGSGMSTSQFIEAKIHLAFPNVIIKDTVPLLKTHELNKDDQDFVISTVPLQLEDIEVVVVSPMLGKSDMNRLTEMFEQSREKQSYHYGIYSQLVSHIKENICFFKCDCRSREEVITLLGTRLIMQKYVDEGFIESVLKRENLAPTSIGDGFAIPHSFKGHIVKPGIGFMTLKKPIQWGEEKVQMILMIALDPKNKDSFRVIFGQLASLTKDVDKIQKILDANHYKEFLNAFK